MASDRPLRLAVLTSGGDCSGMNAAVRAVVKTGISRYDYRWFYLDVARLVKALLTLLSGYVRFV
jgi:6-phosphofructokinase